MEVCATALSLSLYSCWFFLSSRSLGQGRIKPASLGICERPGGREEVREEPSLVGSEWPGAPGDRGARDTTNRRACSGSPVMVTGCCVSPHTSRACRVNQHLPGDPCRVGGWMDDGLWIENKFSLVFLSNSLVWLAMHYLIIHNFHLLTFHMSFTYLLILAKNLTHIRRQSFHYLHFLLCPTHFHMGTLALTYLVT
jgi:hypothetical protein